MNEYEHMMETVKRSTPIDPDIQHKDGVPWDEAPVPSRLHNCWIQSSGWSGDQGLYQWLRCACGAVADGIDIKAAREVGMSRFRQNRFWQERNSRRK